MARRFALVLAALAFAFFLRVLGQALVVFFEVSFLPPMERWYSGLVPYPILLPIQIVILVVQAKISIDLWRETGRFAHGAPTTGVRLQSFSYLYAAVMAARYVLTMALYPERRWFTGTIPIFFHFVLAGYLFTLGRYYLRRSETELRP